MTSRTYDMKWQAVRYEVGYNIDENEDCGAESSYDGILSEEYEMEE